MNQKTREALELVKRRCEQIDQSLLNEDVMTDIKKVMQFNKERSNLTGLYDVYQEFLLTENSINDARDLLENEKDPEMREFAKIQLEESNHRLTEIEKEIELLLVPKDPNDEKNVIIEIRGAAGGDEANIFAGDLYRMYMRYAEKNNWKIKTMAENISEAGGYSLVSFIIKGNKVFSKMKFEAGAHRVQRVPKTESKGRIQTSTATVVVLPEVSDVEVIIKQSDLRIDTYRASGAGGQHVNTTDSAVRVTHIPTGIVSSSQDGRSQHDNKDIAMTMLRAKIYEAELEKKREAESKLRKSAGSGDRSEKIRTYNFPDNRVTDHRIGMSINKLDRFLEGDMEEIISELLNNEKKEKISEQFDE
ncbi:peptide chain release factor 1 [Spiroplasma endosymbiont of Aspidapion aeneum]|uniref:peptide chain release factor 1 n=1 Tax=Spiroplasma endosymbiont of Aspidapion aeneum TaxID=3066276 RepID=UPI00313C2480